MITIKKFFIEKFVFILSDILKIHQTKKHYENFSIHLFILLTTFAFVVLAVVVAVEALSSIDNIVQKSLVNI
jgi:uncharacterized membrane protein YidH (DUF202 family)